MAGFNQGTKALAQAIAGAERAHELFRRDGDDAAYEALHASQMLERARVKHLAKNGIDAAQFQAEIEAAKRTLDGEA